MLNWFRQLDKASTPAEVVSVLRDYLSSWSPSEVAKLPAACRPGRMKGESDVEGLHLSLVEEYRKNLASGPALTALQRLTSVVVRASMRIAQLRGEDTSRDCDPAPDPTRRAARRES